MSQRGYLSCRWCGFGQYVSRKRLPSGRLVALCDRCQPRLDQAVAGNADVAFMVAVLEKAAAARDARSGKA